MQKAPPAMFARHDERPFSLGRFFVSVFLVFAIVAAAALSASPSLHEHLHPHTTSTHLCLVTLFASGQCEPASAAPVCAPPLALPLLATLPLAATAFLPAAQFFCLLEHAPPAFA
jgi:hypothetical protein